jgi:hypothetical protein
MIKLMRDPSPTYRAGYTRLVCTRKLAREAVDASAVSHTARSRRPYLNLCTNQSMKTVSNSKIQTTFVLIVEQGN